MDSDFQSPPVLHDPVPHNPVPSGPGTRDLARQGAALCCALLVASCAAPTDENTSISMNRSFAWSQVTEDDGHHRLFTLDGAEGRHDNGSLTTPILEDGQQFDEVLPSWNVAPEVPFAVEVRVSAGANEPWSDWLRIGDWNVDERTGDEPMGFPDGRVAVDVLRLETPKRLAQLRLTPWSNAALELASVHVVLTDTATLPARLAETSVQSWPPEIALSVPKRSQRLEDESIAHRICSPTSVAMVTAFHGAELPTAELAATILDPHFGLYGNWNRAVQGAYSVGIPGRLVRVSSWDTVRRHLEARGPLIASIRAKPGELGGAPYKQTDGHLLVVTGLGPQGAVYVNDPAAKSLSTVSRVYSRADMETVWFANGGVAYALEAPRAH